MPDDTRPSQELGSSASLARIADALGLPKSYFYTAAGGAAQIDDRSKLEDTAVLALVRSYLRAAPPEARCDFMAAVKAIADGLPP